MSLRFCPPDFQCHEWEFCPKNNGRANFFAHLELNIFTTILILTNPFATKTLLPLGSMNINNWYWGLQIQWVSSKGVSIMSKRIGSLTQSFLFRIYELVKQSQDKTKSGFFQVTFLQSYPKFRGLITDTETLKPVDPVFWLQSFKKKEVHLMVLAHWTRKSLVYILSFFSRTRRSK